MLTILYFFFHIFLYKLALQAYATSLCTIIAALCYAANGISVAATDWLQTALLYANIYFNNCSNVYLERLHGRISTVIVAKMVLWTPPIMYRQHHWTLIYFHNQLISLLCGLQFAIISILPCHVRWIGDNIFHTSVFLTLLL